ncbi:hypothetical protein BH09MYX1_BH09MYX1_06980 [soil metagenome]
MRHAVLPSLLLAAVALLATQRDAVADDPPCDAWEIEYATTGTLAVRDTPMSAGNADHPVGPGTVVVRFDNATGVADGSAKMLSFNMKELFTGVYFNTKITTDIASTATPTTSCSVAEGTMTRSKLTWGTKVRGFKVDGSLTCEGPMCGKFGGPPSGKSDYHDPAHDVELGPFEYQADLKTFTMTASLISKGDSPKQSTYIAMAGRESKRTCVRAKPCK